MNYIENIYICLTAPLVIAVICVPSRGRRMMLFLLSGMTACLLSSYISTFIAAYYQADLLTASFTIAPLVEEIMKLLPILFYLLVFEPGKEEISGYVIMVAIGFATFENTCYLIQNGAANILHLLIRGFETGALHVICGFIISIGILFLWDQLWLRIAGIFGLLAAAVTVHGIYNTLVSQGENLALVGYLIPLVTAIFIATLRTHFFLRKKPSLRS